MSQKKCMFDKINPGYLSGSKINEQFRYLLKLQAYGVRLLNGKSHKLFLLRHVIIASNNIDDNNNTIIISSNL